MDETLDEPDFTQADNNRLQKLQTGVSSVQDRRDNGYLDDETADDLMGQIQSQLKPLQQRKQAAAQASVQKQQAMGLHAAAQAKAMQMQDSQADTQNFQTKEVEHPETGQKMVFFQHEPGKWTQADGGETAPEEDAAPAQPEQLPQPQLAANPDGTHVMTIQNGAGNLERITFARDPQTGGYQTTARQELDPRTGQEIQRQGPTDLPGNADGSLTNAQRQEIRKQAMQTVGDPPPATDRNGRPSGHYTEWMKTLQAEVRSREQEQVSLNLNRTKSQAASTEHQRQETARTMESQRKEAARAKVKASEEHAEKWQKNYGDDLQKRISSWEKRNENAEMPDDVRRQLTEQAKKHADDLHLSSFGFLPSARQAQLGDAEEDIPASVASTALHTENPAKMLKRAKDQAALDNPQEAGMNPKPQSYWDRVKKNLDHIKDNNAVELPGEVTPGGTKAKAAQEPPAPKVEPLPKDKFTPAEIKTELERRAREKSMVKPPDPGFGFGGYGG